MKVEGVVGVIAALFAGVVLLALGVLVYTVIAAWPLIREEMSGRAERAREMRADARAFEIEARDREERLKGGAR